MVAYRDCKGHLVCMADAQTGIEAIAQTFADSGITEFTISSRFSDLIPTLAAFDKLGFKMAGMTEVNAAYTDWQTGKHPRLPAIRLERR